jgi:hypothetical protein
LDVLLLVPVASLLSHLAQQVPVPTDEVLLMKLLPSSPWCNNVVQKCLSITQCGAPNLLTPTQVGLVLNFKLYYH